MPTHKSYHSYLIKSLKDPLEAAAYLEAALEDGNAEQVALAIKNVAEAQRSHPENSTQEIEQNDRDRSNFQGDNLDLSQISALLNKLGLKLSVSVLKEKVA